MVTYGTVYLHQGIPAALVHGNRPPLMVHSRVYALQLMTVALVNGSKARAMVH